MNILLGILFFAVLVGFCAASLRRFACETDLSMLVLASTGMSGILLVLGGALLLPWFSPVTAMLVLFCGCAAGLGWMVKTSNWEPLKPRKDALWLTLAALPGGTLAGFFALFLISCSFGVDDGFFLHSSNIGMIEAGKYPPTSFLGEPWQGHYGKDILTALCAVVFQVSFLEVEWFSTASIQVLMFFFMVHWFRMEGGKPSHGLLGAHFAFFGSAFCSYMGLGDLLSNNNAVAFLAVSICSYLLLRWYHTGLMGAAVLAGTFLGIDALIYEIHFGLMGLALFTITVLRKDRYKGFFLLVGVAVFLAAVQGGPITHIASKALFGRAQHQQDAKKAWQSQNVEIKIPKDNLFHLRRDNLRPSRFFETKLRPKSVSFEHSRETAPLLSTPILSVFWYPTWLAPLVLLAIGWQRNLIAAWFFAFGFFSVLTPSIVSFGYFEGETTRWLFGTALGFSIAFALVLAQALHHSKKQVRYVAIAFLIWSVWFNIPQAKMEAQEALVVLKSPGIARHDGSPGIIPGSGLVPHTRVNLAHHHKFDEHSFALTDALKERAAENPNFLTEKFLVNVPDEKMAQGIEVAAGGILNILGFQTGLSGRLPAGLAEAPDNIWSSPLFSQNLRARLFWYDPQVWRLQELGARWLMVDRSRLSPEEIGKLEQLPGLEVVAESGQQVLWEIPEWTDETPPHNSVAALLAEDLNCYARQGFTIRAQLETEATGATQLEFRYEVEVQVANPDDLLADRMTVQAGLNEVEIDLVGPYFPGSYKLEWRVSGETDWKPLCGLTVSEKPAASEADGGS